MIGQVVFIQGAGEEGYRLDLKLVDSLQRELGQFYVVSYPRMETDENGPDFNWPIQIGQALSAVKGKSILVGHSLGASMILKYLSQNKLEPQIELCGVFLLATPYWSGEEGWKKGLKLDEHFASHLPRVPIFMYHSPSDEEVEYRHFSHYQENLASATFRELPGGHQFNDQLAQVARDILSVSE